MDPTAEIIRIKNSFSGNVTHSDVVKLMPATYSYESSPKDLKLKIMTDNVSNISPNEKLCDINRYNALQKVKSTYSEIPGKDFTVLRNKANPFENIGNSIFMNRAAVKLANVDIFYNLTNSWGGLLQMQQAGQFSFLDIAAGPGGFTQYIQWRRYQSNGFGMTLKTDIPSLEWNLNKLDTDRFVPYYGTDSTGNLYTNWKSLIKWTMEQSTLGMNLVTADGEIPESINLKGLSPEQAKAAQELEYSRQEFRLGRLLTLEMLVAISCLRDGGNCMIKIFDTVTTLSAELILIFSTCFEEIAIIKPISSRPANSERYLLGLRKKMETNHALSILENASEAYTDDKNVVKILANDLPDNYSNWLKTSNNLSINMQIKAAQEILKIRSGEEPSENPYDLFKALVVWHLPDNVK